MAGEDKYIAGRITYARPQGMLWSDNPGTYVSGVYVPTGSEIGGMANGDSFLILSDDNRKPIDFTPTRLENRQRMINGRMRSYHIADKLTISTSWDMLPSRSFAGPAQFIEASQVSITSATSDGTKITYAATNTYSVGDVVSVSGTTLSGFNVSGVQITDVTSNSFKVLSSVVGSSTGGVAYKTYAGKSSGLYADYTSDGGAGGVEILDWYENHTGPFFVFLAYDKYTNMGDKSSANTFTQLKEYNQVVEMYISDFSYSVQKRGGSNMDMWNISVTLEEV